MVSISQLWLPIVVSAVILFVASSVIWMFAPHHKKEWAPPPNVEAFRDFLAKSGIGAGAYIFPHMTGAERADKAVAAAKMKEWAEGPSGVLFIVPKGPMNMGIMMAQQFVFFLLIGAFVALMAAHAMDKGALYPHVFKIVGVLAFMAMGLGSLPESIWFGRPWKSYVLQTIDAVVYAALMAGTFGWLWPR